MTAAERIAAFAADLRYEDLPQEVAQSVKQRVLDTLGVVLAGSAFAPARILAGVLREQGGKPEAVPLSGRDPLPAAQAAFLSGTLAHSVEFDDTHLPSIVHPSAFVVPAALTAAQVLDAGGRDVIAAAAAGYEALVRIAMAAYDEELGNSIFFERGLHGASICGALASAVTAAKLLGADAERTMHALGIAASFGSGILEANRTGGTVKQIQAGWACHAGVYAAKLAIAGITAPATVLEGRFGFFQALLGEECDILGAIADLGERWETPGIVFKPYPTNHFTHTGIDAAIALRGRLGGPVEPAQVEALELLVATSTVRTIGQPREAKTRPQSGYHARFSGPYTVAMALRGGGGLGLALEDFHDGIAADETLRALADKVEVRGDERCDRIFPHHFPAILRLRLASGQVLEEAVLENRGSRARPLSFGEIRTKFLSNAAPVLGEARAEEVAGLCAHLEDLGSIDPLVRSWARD